MDKNSYKNPLIKDPIVLSEDIVTQCLTAECKNCRGSYVNEILNHRFLCRCSCHQNGRRWE